MAGFSANPQTEWLDDRSPDHTMSLLADFWFEDRAGRRWHAPLGSVINGASIPRALWTLVGSPYTGLYRRASIVHDVACELAGSVEERRAADRMFFEACRAGGCSIEEATILYAGVRLGSAWSNSADASVNTRSVNTHPQSVRSPHQRRLEADFQIIADEVLGANLSDDPYIVEHNVDSALAYLSTLPPSAIAVTPDNSSI